MLESKPQTIELHQVYRRLSDEHVAIAREAQTGPDLANGWGCSLSTMYRRLQSNWWQLQPVAVETREKGDKDAKRLASSVVRDHLLSTYSELLADCNAYNRALELKHLRYLVKVLEKKEKKNR